VNSAALMLPCLHPSVKYLRGSMEKMCFPGMQNHCLPFEQGEIFLAYCLKTIALPGWRLVQWVQPVTWGYDFSQYPPPRTCCMQKVSPLAKRPSFDLLEEHNAVVNVAFPL
jgi:hypothetical protein